MNKNLFLLITLILVSCKKSDFLNKKPNQSLVVPETLQDYQAILDNDLEMNGADWGQGLVPQLGESGADNYYLSDDNYNQLLLQQERNAYSWEKNLYTGDPVYDWNIPYRAIFNANVALDGISKLNISGSQQQDYNNIKGSALFFRAHLFYQLAQIFAPPYDSLTAVTDWGVPLRLTGDVNEKINRATLAQTYEKIINDLKEAEQLLPDLPLMLYKTRPCKAAVYALLARTYQTMQHYDEAFQYADKALAIQNELIDYNTLSLTEDFPFPKGFNSEVIFYCNMLGWSAGPLYPIMPWISTVDPALYNSYQDDDLRKSLYFSDVGYMTFTGSYDGGSGGGALFAGLATDEIYLIKAECLARAGQTSEAIEVLNILMRKRWKQSSFVPYQTSDPNEALQKILFERRKELCFRGLRWTDLRRLNKEGANITLTRTVNGKVSTLPPNDLRYTYPIPSQVISFHPDMPQNPR